MCTYNHKTVNAVKFKHQINKEFDNRLKNEKKIIKSNTVRRVSAKINNVLCSCARTSYLAVGAGPRV